MKLVVWLGNPWKQYEKTKHNIWQIFLDHFVASIQAWTRTYEKKWQSDIIAMQVKLKNQDINKEKTCLNTEKVFFLKPQTYMNHSWDAVATLAKFYHFKPDNILILHDDIDLVLGVIKYKVWWGHAGHNWLKDIISKLWNSDFHRIRIWIGRPSEKHEVANYVLSTFSQTDEQIIMDKTEIVFDYIKNFLWI